MRAPFLLACLVVLGPALAGCKTEKKDVADGAPSRSVPSASAPLAAPPASALVPSDGGRMPGPSGKTDAELAPLRANIRTLAPLHVRVGKPKPGEWRAEHPEEGETFEQYLNAGPVTPTAARSALVVQPLGDLGTENERVLATVAKAMQAFFGLSTRVVSVLSLRIVPASARRPSRGFGEQLLTSRILKELGPRLPDDAMAYIAFTSSDLWPGDDWNYVFGQASLERRVGVWSLARNGNTSAGEAAYRLALSRAIKTATHETGHMFGMHHCTAYRCNMAGVNSLPESDGEPSWLCPECLAKLSWATGTAPEEHLRRMHAFAKSVGMDEEVKHYAKSLAALGVAVPAGQ
jgi:archaemetzincin